MLQGAMALIDDGLRSTFDIVFGAGFLAIGIIWTSLHLISKITVTSSVVIVQRGLFQDLYDTESILNGSLETRSIGPLQCGLVVNGQPLRIPFLIRPQLIIESARRLRGCTPDTRTEPRFHGRERGLI